MDHTKTKVLCLLCLCKVTLFLSSILLSIVLNDSCDSFNGGSLDLDDTFIDLSSFLLLTI